MARSSTPKSVRQDYDEGAQTDASTIVSISTS